MKEIGRVIRDFFTKADIFLLCVCILCTGYGILLISSAARVLSSGARPYLITQAMALGIGIGVFVVLSLVDINLYCKLWKWIAVFNVGFIGILYWFGQGDQGNKSWLRYSWLPFDVQPAEIVKLTFVILMAFHMYSLKDRINKILPLLSILAHFGVIVGLILFASKDLGVALIYVFAFFCMLIGAGVKPRWFLVVGAMGAGAMPLLWNWMSDTLKMRIIYTYSPEYDPENYGWQLIQSKRAFSNGGFFGTGLYKGTQTQSFRIPKQWTDFILTAAGEELGFFASLLVLLLLMTVVARCLYMATKAQNGYGALICIGVAGMIIFQTFENIGMCIGLTPIIGVTLPFFSYGGSSLVSMFAAMGLISSIKMRPYPSWIRDRGL